MQLSRDLFVTLSAVSPPQELDHCVSFHKDRVQKSTSTTIEASLGPMPACLLSLGPKINVVRRPVDQKECQSG